MERIACFWRTVDRQHSNICLLIVQGVVSGVLLVTPSNIMFDPHKADVLVQQSGCAEYGIMCPLDELLSAAMCTEVTDARIKEFVPP